MTTKGSFFDLQTPKMQLYAYTKTYMREGERERGKVKGGEKGEYSCICFVSATRTRDFYKLRYKMRRRSSNVCECVLWPLA